MADSEIDSKPLKNSATSTFFKKSNEVLDEGTDDVMKLAAERETNVASDPLEGIGNESEESTKHEIEIEEWEMPINILPQRNKLESTESCNINSSDCLGQMDISCENLSSKNSSFVVSTSGILGENKKMCEENIKTDLFSDKESFLTLKSKSGENSAKSGSSSSGMTVPSKKKFVCDICKKIFVTKWLIRVHLRVHYDEKPFKCIECGKSFKWESNKVVHELIHLKEQKKNKGDKKRSTEKCNVCEICKKEFSTLQNLHQHSNLHKNKYLCSVCGRRCCSKTNLDRHSMIHTNEKPFSCKVCKKTFSRKVTLKDHLAIHSEDCPFQCNVCDKRFKTKNHKNKHELFHLRSK